MTCTKQWQPLAYLVATELHATEIVSLEVYLTTLCHARWVPAMQRCWKNAKGITMSGHLHKESSGLRCRLCLLGAHQIILACSCWAQSGALYSSSSSIWRC